MSKHSALRTKLEARLGELVGRVGRIETDLRSRHNPDSQDRAAEIENDEVLEGLDEMTRAEVLSIRATMRRIESGRYGFCSECGEAVGAERLKAVPTAATCIYCAR